MTDKTEIPVGRIAADYDTANIKMQAVITKIAMGASSPEGKKTLESLLGTLLKVHLNAVASCIQTLAVGSLHGKQEEAMGMLGLHTQGMIQSMDAMMAVRKDFRGDNEPKIETTGVMPPAGG